MNKGRIISERLLDQRLRNRIMESLDWLTDAETGFEFGAGQWFNQFFDQAGSRVSNSAMTHEERSAFDVVLGLMKAAVGATPKHVTVDELQASGWLDRIVPAARTAHALMCLRGRFSEEIEEEAPRGL